MIYYLLSGLASTFKATNDKRAVMPHGKLTPILPSVDFPGICCSKLRNKKGRQHENHESSAHSQLRRSPSSGSRGGAPSAAGTGRGAGQGQGRGGQPGGLEDPRGVPEGDAAALPAADHGMGRVRGGRGDRP